MSSVAERKRCAWAGTDSLYVAYHDEEWGVPEFDSRALFEKLILDGFQAGLSWITILRKRDAFRAAFANFDPEKIACFNAKKIAALMNNPGIIRNRAKIEGTVVSARVYLEIEAHEGFSDFLWKFFDGRPQQNGFRTRAQIPTQSAKSVALSKGLKDRGFKFCGRPIRGRTGRCSCTLAMTGTEELTFLPLRLPQLFLKHSALGNIIRHSNHVMWLSGAVAQQKQIQIGPHDFLPGQQIPLFHVIMIPYAVDQFLVAHSVGFFVVGMRQLIENLVIYGIVRAQF